MNPAYQSLMASLVATSTFIAFLLLEKLLLRMARHRFQLVIHVNGTRGKSTVTRMIHAVLRESGYHAWGKTTGTEPRLLLPDGTERVIRRIAPANVREQRNMALRAACAGANALVFECNAILPELQRISSEYLKPDLLVITNARLDHRPEQGSVEEVARAFAATIPAGGAIASSDTINRALWQDTAERRNSRYFFVDPSEGAGLVDLPENVACALAVADWIGLSRRRASRAIACYHADPGAFSIQSWPGPSGARIWFADASAANDPDSTDRLAVLALKQAEACSDQAGAGSEGHARIWRVLVIANRADRQDRALMFADYAIAACSKRERFDEVAFLGPLPLRAQNAVHHSGIRYRYLKHAISLDSLGDRCSATVDMLIVSAGNRGGPGRDLHDWALAKAGRIATQ